MHHRHYRMSLGYLKPLFDLHGPANWEDRNGHRKRIAIIEESHIRLGNHYLFGLFEVWLSPKLALNGDLI